MICLYATDEVSAQDTCWEGFQRSEVSAVLISSGPAFPHQELPGKGVRSDSITQLNIHCDRGTDGSRFVAQRDPVNSSMGFRFSNPPRDQIAELLI